MSPEIERVARALCWKNGMNPDVSLGGDGVNWLWHEYVEQAKSAITAMVGATAVILMEERYEWGARAESAELALGQEIKIKCEAIADLRAALAALTEIAEARGSLVRGDNPDFVCDIADAALASAKREERP